MDLFLKNISYKFLGKNIDKSSFQYIEKKYFNGNKSQFIHNRKLALNYLDEKYQNFCILKQIHSEKVVIVNEFFKEGEEPEADALVTNKNNLPLAIVTADCVPILLADPVNKVIGAIHAGWKGARSSLIANTVKSMQTLGSSLANIVAIIGPCIHQKSYEVDAEFYDNFKHEFIGNVDFFIPSTTPNHYMFDLLSYTKFKLAKHIQKIKDESVDTFVNEETLFSYRRSKLKLNEINGSNLAIISMNY